jgi:protoheme IX farnesyltransferase
LPFNPALAFFLFLGAFIYVVVYTLWLKPRTTLNIVIGGAAGSCAVLSGSAAAGDWSHPTAVGLAFLIFVWTPVHFWSLAQVYRDDYASAGVPMLPLVASARATAWWIGLHTAVTAFVALVLSVDPALGWLYLAPVGVATIWVAHHAVRLIRQPQAHAIHLFKCSNIYLGLVLVAIFIGTMF